MNVPGDGEVMLKKMLARLCHIIERQSAVSVSTRLIARARQKNARAKTHRFSGTLLSTIMPSFSI